MEAECRSLHLWLLVSAAACGPSVAVSSGSDSDSSNGQPSPTTSSSTPATSGDSSLVTVTSVGPTEDRPDSSSSTGYYTSSTSTGFASTGGGCNDAPPAIAPTVPEGCTSIPLVDPIGAPLPDSPSGLVRCAEDGAPDDGVFSIFRTGKVVCPFSTGDCACDSDCDTGQQCLCDYYSGGRWPDQDGNRCTPSDCSSDTDCEGQRCRAQVVFCGSYGIPNAFRCTSDSDDCDAHTTCIEQGGQGPHQYCAYDNTMEMFTCEPGAVCE